MSHRLLLAGAALFALAVSAVATPFTEAFTDLRDAMQTRKDALLADTPDKTEKREAKALGTSIKKLAKPATTLGADLKDAVAVFKGLEKTFPDELKTKTTPSFASLVAAALAVLDGYVEAQYALLVTDLPGVSDPKLHAKAEADRAIARTALDLVPTTQPASEAAGLLVTALKFVGKGRAVAASQPHVDAMTASVNGLPFAAKNFDVTVVVSAGVIDAIGYVNDPKAPSFRRVEFVFSNGAPITGSGPFTATGTYDDGTTPSSYAHHTSFSATVTLSTFDLAGKHLVGDFSFTTNEPILANQTKVLGGHFDIRHFRAEK